MGKDGTAGATLHAFAAAAHERLSSIYGEKARRMGTRLLLRPDKTCTRDGFCKLDISLDVSRKRKKCIPYPFLEPRLWDHGHCKLGKGSSLRWPCLLLLPSQSLTCNPCTSSLSIAVSPSAVNRSPSPVPCACLPRFKLPAHAVAVRIYPYLVAK